MKKSCSVLGEAVYVHINFYSAQTKYKIEEVVSGDFTVRIDVRENIAEL